MEKQRAAESKSKVGKRDGDGGKPIVLGNAVMVAVLGAALGVGAYRKYSAGELSWRVLGAWGGVVGVFAVGDWWVSR